MRMFYTELHAHTAETSRCAKDSAETLVENYKKAGYRTVVITDHLSPSTFEAYKSKSLSWDEKIDIFLRGYHAAKQAAGADLNILLGMELRFDRRGNINDYLVYGVTEEFLRKSGDLLQMRLPSFSKLAHQNRLLVFQAHPFRNGMKIVNPEHLDGIEVYNACIRHNSRNGIAQRWARLHHLRGTSGSDYHRTEDTARGGILTASEIRSNDELLRILSEQNYTLVKK